MTLQMTRVVPELLFYTELYVKGSVTNKFKIPFPPTFSISYLNENKSFIRLLFDDNWPMGSMNYLNYRYLYRQETDLTSIPEALRRRMSVYPGISSYYVCDSDSISICNINVFNLQSDDLNMLDNLLQYRLDSTSVNITLINYNSLDTTLSKLIYIYLNFKINHQYVEFDNVNPLSSDIQVLEGFYESYLTDLIFIYESSLGT
jgi:hypothetical protein